MNPKLATLLIALSLPLAGCGNKGPLVLPQKPVPVEADMLPVEPPADDATPADDAVDPAGDTGVEAGADVPPATDATSDDETPPLPSATDDGNG